MPTLLLALLWVVTPASALTAAVPSVTEGAAARAVVESLHSVLMTCMKDADTLGFEGRYERISAELEQAFDMPFMARLSLGSAWKDLNEDQRKDFQELSRRLSSSHYARNFSGYGGERFETVSYEPAARGTMLVKTTLVLPEGDDVAFDYRLREDDGRWRIIDVQLNGMVSELAMRRAQYRSVIQREGYPQLVESVVAKIDELADD